MGGDGQSDKPLVRFDVEDGVGVITIDNPPVNALGPGVRDGIVEAVEKGEADPNVKAMVLIGAGRSFIAGADIRAFGKPRPTPRRLTYDVLDRQHEAGGGGDPRLRAGRRAGARARLPLPHRRAERQGRPARGADRHPAGRRRHAAPAAPDRPEGGDGDDRLRPPRAGRGGQGARHHRRDRRRQGPAQGGDRASPSSVAGKRPLPRVRDKTDQLAEAKADPGMFEAMRKSIARKARNQKAPYHCIACVEAADDASRSTRASRPSGGCSRSWRTPTRRRRCATRSSPSARWPRFPGLPKDLVLPEIKTAAVVGAGTMGGGIAMSFADFGFPVKLLDASPEVLDEGHAAHPRQLCGQRQARQPRRRRRWTSASPLIEPVESYEEIADCDVVIEAVFEQMPVKKEVFAKLDAVMKPGALLLTNTSALDIDEMASVTKRPRGRGRHALLRPRQRHEDCSRWSTARRPRRRHWPPP